MSSRTKRTPNACNLAAVIAIAQDLALLSVGHQPPSTCIKSELPFFQFINWRSQHALESRTSASYEGAMCAGDGMVEGI